jgi:class 3 adenylate cyclase
MTDRCDRIIELLERHGKATSIKEWHEFHTIWFGECVFVQQVDMSDRVEMDDMVQHLISTQTTLLAKMFPKHVIEAFVSGVAACDSLTRSHDMATIMFMDVVGFTQMSSDCTPSEVMIFLNTLFDALDKLCDIHGVHKLETAGDSYIACSGILCDCPDTVGYKCVVEDPNPVDAAVRMVRFAIDLVRHVKSTLLLHQRPIEVRVGIHSGPCSSGVIGRLQPKFAVFGDTMNIASRMESTSLPGHIQLSRQAFELVDPSMDIGLRGRWLKTNVKGKGVIDTFVMDPEIFPVAPVIPKISQNGASSSTQTILQLTSKLMRVVKHRRRRLPGPSPSVEETGECPGVR